MATPVTIVDSSGIEINETNPLASGGYRATASWTPDGAAYSANDVMSTAQTLSWVDRSGVLFPGGELMITSVSLEVDETALQASEADYNLHLYSVTPPSAHADNAAWDLPSGDRAAYVGKVYLGTPVDIGSTALVETDSINKQITVASTGLTFAELVTIAGFTATAVVRKVTLHAVAI